MKVSLDDLALFLAIADAGGLAGAARATGVSQPTLSRRMQRLETELGKRLFLRGSLGYCLTAEGRDLVPLVRDMSAKAHAVDDWAGEKTAPRRVRVSAGHWTALWLGQRIGTALGQAAIWQPDFVTADARLDIARREVDIGIRNTRPDQSWLAGQPMRDIRYAAFARDHETGGWVLAGRETAPTPSARWVLEQSGGDIRARATDPRLAAALAAQGLGRIVLPTFAAKLVPGLQQVSDEIAPLAHREWLVSHHDTRFDPQVRAALDALATLLSNGTG